MSGMITRALRHGDTVIGKPSKDQEPDVSISGVGIAHKHCVIKYDEELRMAIVTPNAEDPEKFVIKINGQPVIGENVHIKHGDRILIGTNHYWLVVDPKKDAGHMIDYETAMKEANAEQLKLMEQDNEEFKKIKEQAEKMRLEKEAKEKEMAAQLAEFEEARRKQEEELEARKKELMSAKG